MKNVSLLFEYVPYYQRIKYGMKGIVLNVLIYFIIGLLIVSNKLALIFLIFAIILFQYFTLLKFERYYITRLELSNDLIVVDFTFKNDIIKQIKLKLNNIHVERKFVLN